MGKLGVISLMVVIGSILLVLGEHIELPLTKIKSPPSLTKRFGKRTEVDLEGSYATTSTYYTTINLGTPPQAFNVIVDTGSSDLIVYAKPCSGCDATLNAYNPSASSTTKTIPCTQVGYNQQENVVCTTCNSRICGTEDQYGDGSIFIGTLYSDKFTISNISSATVTFSGISSISQNGDFGGAIDGLWGLAYYELAFAIPVYDNLVEQVNIVNSFSMCLNDSYPRMYLGVDYSQVPGFKWTPIIDEAWYTIKMSSVSVDGTKLAASATALNNTIMDSGTTDIILKDVLFNEFTTKLTAMCNSGVVLSHYCGVTTTKDNIITGSSCFVMTDLEINAYPTLTLEFPGAGTFDISPQLYLYQAGRFRCGGIANAGELDTNILGDVFMQGYNIVFDRYYGRLGFGDESTCGIKGNDIPPNATSTSTTTDGSTSDSVKYQPILALLALFSYLLL